MAGNSFSLMGLKPALACFVALLALRCSGTNDSAARTSTATTGADTGAKGEPADARAPTEGEPNGDEADAGLASDDSSCSAPEGISGNPKTIYQALELINALPHPVELSCFLESLDRPLAINATSSANSVQPALGKDSPRIFLILNDSLNASLVPGAEPTLEFGERLAGERISVKAELLFPIERELAPEDFFNRLAPDPATGLTLDEGTNCGKCHDNEAPAADYPFRGAFASAMVKPQPFFAVDVDYLRERSKVCDPTSEPERCAVLDALFDHGNVVSTAFP